MKLWLLEARDDLPKTDNPWEPWYDKAFGFIVRAETEQEARQIATKFAGDETDDHKAAWENGDFSTCSELMPDGESGMVLRDYHAA